MKNSVLILIISFVLVFVNAEAMSPFALHNNLLGKVNVATTVNVKSENLNKSNSVNIESNNEVSMLSSVEVDTIGIIAAQCQGTNSENTTAITSTSAKLNWTEAGTAASWDIEYGIAGFSQGSGTTVNNILTQMKTINGLSNSTDYDWYVRSDCGLNGNSTWRGPFKFTTHSNNILNTPYIENFDAMANVGFNVYPSGMSGNNFITSSFSTSHIFTSSGNKCIQQLGDTDTLFSAPVNLVMNTSYDFSIMYRKSYNFSATASNFIMGVVRSKTGVNITNLKTIHNYEIDAHYKQCRATYTPTTSETVYLVLIVNNGNYNMEPYFDDFKIEATPTYLPPSEFYQTDINISSAKLIWEEEGAATSWQIEYKYNSDFTPGTGTADQIINVNNNKFVTINNLIHNSYYYWYIRSNNGGGNYSEWMGHGWFKTDRGYVYGYSPLDGANPIAVNNRTINWHDVDGADSYRISIGSTPGGNDIVNNVACATSEYLNPQNWQYGTHHYWTVTIVYSGGHTIVGQEYEFLTECQTINNFPYTTGFENGVPEDCWFQEDESGVAGKWASATHMIHFYYLPPHSGTYMAEFNSKYASSGSSTRLYTPQLDLTGLTNPEVNFWMFFDPTLSGANDRVQVQVDNGGGWVNLGAPIARYHSGYGWKNHFIDLSAYANQIVRVAFLGISGHGREMYIDDVSIQEAPACHKPYNLTVSNTVNYNSRSLKWVAADGTNAWQIEYGFAGFTQGTGTVINIANASPYFLSGLLAGADYEWYVRSDCGGGVYSEWAGPEAFTTKQYSSSSRPGKTTKCSPTYSRLNADGTIGPNVQYFYDKRNFSVGTTGWYDMKVNFNNRTGQIHVYQNSFDPLNPLVNWMGAGEGAFANAQHLYLIANTTYIAVGVEADPISVGSMGNMSYKLYGAEVVTFPYYSDIYGEAQGVSRNVPATDGSSRIANYQCVDVNDYTHYYDNNGTPTDYSDDNIVLSVKLNGNTIGSIGDAGFEVLLEGGAGVSLIQPAAAPYVQDAGGWFVYNRYWELTPTQQPTTPVNVRYYYNLADFSALQTAIGNIGGTVPQVHTKTAYFKINSIIGNYSPNPADGHNSVPLATSYNTDGCWIYEYGVAPGTNTWSFGNYGTAFYAEYQVGHFSGGGGGASPQDDNGSPLPLTLSSFYAYENGKSNIIKWNTLSEENTNEFIIERSEDNTNYQSIASFPAAGNSNSLLEYSILDNEPTATAYYRLRTVDFDGKFTISNIAFVSRNDAKADLQINQLFPNPTIGKLWVVYNSKIDCVSKVEITNMLGNTMMERNVNSNEGGNELNLNLQKYPSGVYFIRISNKQSSVVKRIIVNSK